jgi:hypothetical protein
MSHSLLSHKPIETSTGSVAAVNTENMTYLKAIFFGTLRLLPPIPVAARSKACVSAAARLLGLWVRILPGARMSVSYGCCQAEVSATGRTLIQRSPTECACVSLSVIRRNNKFCNYNEQLVRGQEVKTKNGRKEERRKERYFL